jgi:hypothetical protein
MFLWDGVDQTGTPLSRGVDSRFLRNFGPSSTASRVLLATPSKSFFGAITMLSGACVVLCVTCIFSLSLSATQVPRTFERRSRHTTVALQLAPPRRRRAPGLRMQPSIVSGPPAAGAAVPSLGRACPSGARRPARAPGARAQPVAGLAPTRLFFSVDSGRPEDEDRDISARRLAELT